ncbi:Transformer-2 protein alpha [Mitosporidium daphniae]|uniref:Transformer-2 alpha n=1 Tax=Mitosporidium daphniae TaxID=1485682 RepID=A0A098VU40_9MICR|nr:transformer-2 alpha [Mitosporidium daphniae]KGG52455.1 transformer-2 alpha [Mitosporidium daphniae]|eukprot:XP_013238922.1 transformer-2 alpha [Mitosporidium daphniae]
MEYSSSRSPSRIPARYHANSSEHRGNHHGNDDSGDFYRSREFPRDPYHIRADRDDDDNSREAQRRKLAPPNSVIGVFGLSEDTTESDLKELFSPFGEIKKINLIFDRETGRFKCFAFVYFESVGSASRALQEKNETELKGNLIRIDFSATARNSSFRSTLPQRISSGDDYYHRDSHHHAENHQPTDSYSRYAYRDSQRGYINHTSFDRYTDRAPSRRYDDYPPRRTHASPPRERSYSHRQYDLPTHYDEHHRYSRTIQDHQRSYSPDQYSRFRYQGPPPRERRMGAPMPPSPTYDDRNSSSY